MKYSKRIEKQEYSGDWPFKAGVIDLEREGDICTVVIDNNHYALNGHATDVKGYPHVHDAQMTIVVNPKSGERKPIQAFIDMAFDLPGVK